MRQAPTTFCRKKNRLVAEYALRGSLPTIEEIEAELAGDLPPESPKLSTVLRELHPQAAEFFKDIYSLEFLGLPTKDEEVVEYALSRSLSPAMIAEYETLLPDKALLRAKLHEFYQLCAPSVDAG